jgi:hypothetical protein
LPVVEHPSAVPPQSTHAAPSGPQAVAEGIVHVEPEQQPPVQDTALQTQAPPMQT